MTPTSTFVLVPGAGGVAWYWSRVIPLLQRAGHEAIAVDLPGDDENAGLPDYARLVVAAIGERHDVVLVAQSLGAFTAPLVCSRASVRELVLVNAMIPNPGETPGAWWDNTGWLDARERAAQAGGYSTEFDLDTYFLHDVPPEVTAEGEPHQRPEANAVFESACDFVEWPGIPIGCLPATATGSSRSTSSAESRANASVWTRMLCKGATSSHFRTRMAWPITSCDVELRH